LGQRELIEQVRKSGLRGRGGAGFPTATKWDAVLSQEKKPHYFICNIAEGEPGSFKDRELIKNPHMVLEATAIAAFATGAEKAFLYLRGIFSQEEASLKRASIAARNHKFVGKDGMLPVEMVIHRGEDSYIAGEETAMIESLEGKPAIPRVKPPRPHESGLWECPTGVNNVETICNVIPILMRGPENFRKLGTPDSPGTKLFCLSGQIRKPGVYECPLGIQLSTLLNDVGGGPLPGRKFVAIFPGGPSTPVVPVELDPAMDFESLQKVGSHLGTGGVIVIDDSSDLRQIAVQTLSFFMRESCGVCPPCFIGTQELHKLFQIQRSDILKIREFCEMMKYRGQCAHSRAAALTSLSFLDKFPQIFNT
jgi:NADH-quinone oxidoreductase subunit F